MTDADILLGYLDPAFFLGGKHDTGPPGGRGGAIAEKIATPRGLDIGVLEAAWGIHQLANETMASAARIHAVERGKEVSRFPIFAFGGAGPVHACRRCPHPALARRLVAAAGSRRDVVRRLPLTAPLAFDLDPQSALDRSRALDWRGRHGRAPRRDGAPKAAKILSRRPSPVEAIGFRRFADMRYRKQGYEIRVALPDGTLDASSTDAVRQSFEATYRSIYGHTVPGTPVDIVSLRIVAEGPRPELVLPQPGSRGRASLKGRRAAYIPDTGAMAPIEVHDRYALEVGANLSGPVIVEERESTLVVAGNAELHVDALGNLIVDLPGGAA